MKTIKAKNYQGTEFEGEWNEKFYSSKVDSSYYRIYINNQEINITEEEKSKLMEQSDESENSILKIIEKEFRNIKSEGKRILLLEKLYSINFELISEEHEERIG